MKWDAKSRTFGATADDWKVYLQENPRANQFRRKHVLHADKLATIFAGVESTSELEDMEQKDTDDDEEEMYSSDEDSDSSRNRSVITNILISINGHRFRYKDIPQIKNPAVRKQLESMLVNYRKVVGVELSERMVYELR